MSINNEKEIFKPASSFRYDLNFLRAIAVIAVVLFHFQIELFSGGFVGVDVFFVISGFLMTKIIASGLSKNEFSLLKFYLARAKRIIPALAMLCLVLLIIGWFVLLPSEYRLLSKHTASSIVFLSNLIYVNEAGYFDPSSHEKWLLHTWSLSVEWQFYIIFPIVLLFVKRLFGTRYLSLAIAVGALLSFGYMIYLGAISSKSLYFGLVGRAWEMLIGGIAFIYPLRLKLPVRRILFYLGITLILLSVVYFDKQFLWPSLWTVIPILGTTLVIYASYQEGYLVNNNFFKFIGTTSYSIYLWHWPFVVVLSVFSFGYTILNIILGTSLSVIFGWFSYRFIESSASKVTGKTFKQLSIFACFAGVIFSVSVVIFLKNGFAVESRFSKSVITADQEYLNRDPRKAKCLVDGEGDSPHCIYGETSQKPAFILFGDSHASAVINAFAEAVKDKGSVVFIAKAGCLTLLNNFRIGKNNASCHEFVENELNNIKNKYPGVPVVITNRWSFYLKGKLGNDSPLIYFNEISNHQLSFEQQFNNNLENTVCYLSETNPVSLMGPIPEFSYHVPKRLARRLNSGSNENLQISKKQYLDRNAMALNAINNISSCSVAVLDPSPQLCNDEFCFASRENIPLYYDDNHLSESGNRYLIPLFKSLIKNESY